MNINIGIVGATGLVGTILIDLLCNEGYGNNLKLCASDNSIGKILQVSNYSFELVALNESFFNTIDFVFFCADTETSKKWVNIALEKGVFVTDSSSAFRMYDDVPLVIPEINKHLIQTCHGIISSPNCSTSLLCMIAYPLHKNLSEIEEIYVTTYQAVSGAGLDGMKELSDQAKQYSQGEDVISKTFKSQIFGNCFSHNSAMDEDSGYNEEEIKMIQETRKILNSDIKVSPTCVRIPVFRSHSLDVTIKFKNSVNEHDIRKTLSEFDGVKVIDDRKNNKFPEPLLSSGQTDVFVGRIRNEYWDTTDKIYKLWICGDQLLKGASYNAFQIFKEYKKLINDINNKPSDQHEKWHEQI